MIASISLKNFRSFRDLQTLSMDDGKKLDSRPQQLVTIFGPNASGKSNFFKAVQYMMFAVQNMDAIKKQTVQHPLLQPYRLDTGGDSRPTLMEVEIVLRDPDARYRYGFEIHRKEQRVVSEWLIELAFRNERVSERQLYTRREGGLQFDASVPKEISSLKSNVPETILALPALANFNYLPARRVADFIVNKVVILDAHELSHIEMVANRRLTESESLRKRVTSMLCKLDVGILDMRVNRIDVMSPEILGQLPPEFRQAVEDDKSQAMATTTRTVHNKYDGDGQVVGQVQLDLSQNESLGTQKLIPFITLALDTIDQGWTILADEFGSSFHPFISAAIAKLFQDGEHSAQLIAATHETYLLTHDMGLSKHQIWLVDKNRHEQSRLICLDEYVPRADARLDKQYLEGRFGAVPVIMGMDD